MLTAELIARVDKLTISAKSVDAQLIDKLLYCCYMFRHYCVILSR